MQEVREWFREHVTLDGEPYTLDGDQVRAVVDEHKNTLVTARAGSGKTRVIVAKIAYLIARKGVRPDEIMAFMFNRAAAEEVNERIGRVKVDGGRLLELDGGKGGASSRDGVAVGGDGSALGGGAAMDTGDAMLDAVGGKTKRNGDDGSDSGALPRIASTFHKFALDVVTQAGECPRIVSDAERQRLLGVAFAKATQGQILTADERKEKMRLVEVFINRAGQRFCGRRGLERLKQEIVVTLEAVGRDYSLSPAERRAEREKLREFYHLAYRAYAYYLAGFEKGQVDFNKLLMRAVGCLMQWAEEGMSSSASGSARAAECLAQGTEERMNGSVSGSVCAAGCSVQETEESPYAKLKYILIDEYQDFSYLFHAVISALRKNCPEAHLFAVGDDWQAINRFAGSDVDYFLGFGHYFPEDNANIPLLTNYRSAKRIVENANRFMIRNYDRRAAPATAFSRREGMVKRGNPRRINFDMSDYYGDGLDDGRFLRALVQMLVRAEKLDEGDLEERTVRGLVPVARLLKRTCQIIKKERGREMLLLHRNNFTSVQDVSLPLFYDALVEILDEDELLSREESEKLLRMMTIHKSKGLEAEVVIFLEANRDIVLSHHANTDFFRVFGDSAATERADQQRLLYVALTRAKEKLYILSTNDMAPC